MFGLPNHSSKATFGSSNPLSNPSSNPLSKATFGLSNPLPNHLFVSKEMSTYIKDTTNKSLEKYKNKVRFVIPTTTTDLTNDSYLNKDYPLTFFTVLPFVSFMSFLAGYRFFRQMK
jgi:hypothetical protein